jgi:hypothetical protein
MDDVLTIAKSCRHYAMSKIDFLGSGVCASGIERHYVSTPMTRVLWPLP